MKKILLSIILFILSINIVCAETDKDLKVIGYADHEILYSIELEESKVVDTGVKDNLGWTLFIDGEKANKENLNNNIGASLSKGLHSVYLKYEFPFIHEIIITVSVFAVAFSIKRIVCILKEEEI
jgi:hypothetical protein